MGFSEGEKIKIRSAASKRGAEARFFDETNSTNTVLRKMASGGAKEGSVVAADTQTAGRGRLGRRWVSPRGSLFLSILFRPFLKLSLCPASTFMASLALCDTFGAFGVSAEIKWPNDILSNGRKIAGVLSEAEAKDGFCDFVVIGIGVNINLSRADADKLMKPFSSNATSVSEVLGRKTDRGEFASVLIENLFIQQDNFVSKGADWTVAEWAARWGKLNRTVKINNMGKQIEGIARKVDGGGFLYLETRDGALVKIVSGDVC